jgi:hypothetical protein
LGEFELSFSNESLDFLSEILANGLLDNPCIVFWLTGMQYPQNRFGMHPPYHFPKGNSVIPKYG